MDGKGKRKFHQYSEKNLEDALKAIRNGAKIRETCREFGVPRATVQDRIKGRISEKPRQMGPDPILTHTNEKKIVDWIIELSKCGFPVKKQELLSTVQKIIQEKKSKPHLETTDLAKHGIPISCEDILKFQKGPLKLSTNLDPN